VLNKKLSHKDNIADRLMRRIERFYKNVLKKALGAPATIISTAGFRASDTISAVPEG
jgi:cobalt-zinc-cadmium resistance protein CzcA